MYAFSVVHLPLPFLPKPVLRLLMASWHLSSSLKCLKQEPALPRLSLLSSACLLMAPRIRNLFKGAALVETLALSLNDMTYLRNHHPLLPSYRSSCHSSRLHWLCSTFQPMKRQQRFMISRLSCHLSRSLLPTFRAGPAFALM